MGDNSLVNLGDFSKPVTVLIEKISDAIGVVYEPLQIRRKADADAYAETTRAINQIEITDRQRRAAVRWVTEETIKQHNIDSIIEKAIPFVNADAKVENVENDWITNFFDKCRLVSDEEMQTLWSKVLAGEANSQGSYSKRTLNLLSSMDKNDAETLRRLCSFVWSIQFNIPLMFEEFSGMYESGGITQNHINNLIELGLLKDVSNWGWYIEIKNAFTARYGKEEVTIEPREFGCVALPIGNYLFTKPGKELAAICEAVPNIEFYNAIITKWEKLGIMLSLGVQVISFDGVLRVYEDTKTYVVM